MENGQIYKERKQSPNFSHDASVVFQALTLCAKDSHAIIRAAIETYH